MTYLGYPIPGTPCGRMHMAPTGPVPVDGRARIGTCSLCGGDVLGHVGAWWGIIPPPGPRCASCGAVPAADVIEMRRMPSCAETNTAAP